MRARGEGVVARAVRGRAIVVAGVFAAVTITGFGAPGLADAPATGATAAVVCTAAGDSGLTAALVATKGQKISGVVDGTGCDVGIYVGPDAPGVVIDGATVMGANNHGIFLRDTTGVTVENSVVTHNGLAPTMCPPPPAPGSDCISEDKAIQLSGTSNSTVKGNVVVGNLADGGIGISDDGANGVGAPAAGKSGPGENDVVSGNVIANNGGGCGIVVASYNSDAGVLHNTIDGNTVTGNPAGIVIAADAPNTQAIDNQVTNNTVTNNFLPGVIVHSNAPGDRVDGTVVRGNTLSGNAGDAGAAGGQGPAGNTAINIVAEPLPPGTPAVVTPAEITATTVVGNTIGNETFGVWQFGATASTVFGNLAGTSVKDVTNGQTVHHTLAA